MRDLIMDIKISQIDTCKLLLPKPVVIQSTKRNNRTTYIHSRTRFYNSLSDKKIKIYTNLIEPIPEIDTHIAEHIKLKADNIIELNSL